MVKIYFYAARNLVGLGEQDDTARRAWDMLIKFGNGRVKLGKEYSEEVLRQPWRFTDNAFFDAMGMEVWSQED